MAKKTQSAYALLDINISLNGRLFDRVIQMGPAPPVDSEHMFLVYY